MEEQNPISGKRTQCLNSDIISNLPQNITESILCLMPLRDAVRTSVLSKKWQYCWRSVPKLVFTRKLVKSSLNSGCTEWCNLAKAIFHVLLFHKGPQIVEFNFRVGLLHMESEFAQMIRYLAMRNSLKELIFANDIRSYKLPISFFSLQGLERIHIQNCTFEPPSTFNVFSRLKRIAFLNVVVTTQALERFLSKCPLLEHLVLRESKENDFAAGGKKFAFADLLALVPLIKGLYISKYYMKCLCAGRSPHNLPTSLVHLKYLHLDLCLMVQNQILFALCMVRSSPVLKRIVFRMYDNEKLPVQQTPNHFLDSENYPDLKLDHLETLGIGLFSNLPLEKEFVKLIMAKSPMLKKVHLELSNDISADEEPKMLSDMLLLPFPRASPSAKLTFVHTPTR
ncbi:F-box/FBD/LRR-repeat protein At1g13570-like [Bidens hawaiensis]|uniref:F-box/FBD/LRR-repeat protein At1g13570-like n=1 Tax=Bidens hawaiensis TaxID=980011 RepID=UPI004048EFEE